MQTNHWEKIQEVSIEAGILLQKFQSKLTNIVVAIAQVEGPMVNGYVAIPTEAKDDDGCPHVLEHSIFLGSEEYPYKGLLDLVANRCFAEGTNAWTATDHTAYVYQTAGDQGFLQLLPVFIDHILFPLLQQEGFLTEVHHIDGEGKDSGVVYNEMQAIENTNSRLSYRTLKQKLFTDESGYSSETGGKVENLRKLQLEKVKQFHKQLYRPDNMEIIIIGKINPEDVFQKLYPIEMKIKKKNEDQKEKSNERPWSSPLPKLQESVDVTVKFPDDAEETGIVRIGFRGLKYNQFLKNHAIELLLDYLTETAISPLQSAMIEIEDPFCTEIAAGTFDYSETASMFTFEGVPKSKLYMIKDKFFEVINKIISEKNFDLDRMTALMTRQRLQYLDILESKPQSRIPYFFIFDFLYNDPKNADNFKQIFNVNERLKELEAKDKQFWLDLIKESFGEKHYVCVVGEPSKEKGKELQEAEKLRLEKQKQELGDQRIKELDEELKKAIETVSKEIPKEVINSFEIPDISRIGKIPITTQINDEKSLEINEDKEKAEKLYAHLGMQEDPHVPFFIQFDQITSSFVEYRVLLDSSKLPSNLRPFIELYLEVIFKTQIQQEGGELISHEQVVSKLEKDTISYSNSVGFEGSQNFSCGAFGQLVILQIKCESAKYRLGIEWIRDILWNTLFPIERLKVAATTLLNDVARNKRDGMKVAFSGIKSLLFDKEKSNHVATNMINQHKFLTQFMKDLEQNEKSAIDLFYQFRNQLCKLENLRIQVVGDILSLEKPKEPWNDIFVPSKIKEQKMEEKTENEKINQNQSFIAQLTQFKNSNQLKREKKEKIGAVIGLSSVESTFSVQAVNGLESFDHNDIPALSIAIKYLTTMEGIMWNKIRGLGLAYGYGIFSLVEQGFIYFYLYRAGDSVKAYLQTKEMIDDFLSKKIQFEKDEFDAAKTVVISSLIRRESKTSSRGLQSLMDLFRKIPRYNQLLLIKTQQVQIDDLYLVLEKYLKPLFDENSTDLILVTNPSNVQSIQQGFEKMNRKLELFEDVESFFER
ncbi:presequence protease [Anaeramoeba ignava]|uniref:Presequence protease n=1 Tax=Anaeramoeba ignava TaxID=1746090 RepID=A0A9Q0RB86_ANAIG|nr:presequence protease [Anaeramoeba ignava]